MVSSIPNHRMSSGIRARAGMARLICTGPSMSASPARLSPETQGQDGADDDAEDQPQPGALGGDGEVVLEPAVGDQLAGGGHHGPGRGEDTGVEQPRCRAGCPEQQQRRGAQRQASRRRRPGPSRRPVGRTSARPAQCRVLVGCDGGALAPRLRRSCATCLAGRGERRAADGFVAGVVEVRGHKLGLLLSPGPAGRWSAGAVRWPRSRTAAGPPCRRRRSGTGRPRGRGPGP